MKSINELREALGMSLTRFSEFTGIPYRTLQNWELGTNKCADYMLAMLNEQIRPYIESFELTYTRYTWIAVESAGGDEEVVLFLTEDAARSYADTIWNHLTDAEKKKTMVYTGLCELKQDPYTEELLADDSDGIFYLNDYEAE